MVESPPSTTVPTSGHSALARRVVETLLQGGTIEECASEIDAFGGSLLAVYECLDRGLDQGMEAGKGPGAIRRIVKAQEAARAVRLETLKTAALHELWLLAFGDEIPTRGITADQTRAIEARRRACVSLIRLNPFSNSPGARRSVQDLPSPRFFDDGRRSDSSDELRITNDEWDTDTLSRLAATRPKEGERGRAGSSDELRTTNDELRTTNDELRATNDEYGSSDRWHGHPDRAEPQPRVKPIPPHHEPAQSAEPLSGASDAAFACKLEKVQQLARLINRAKRDFAEFANRDVSDIDAIEHFASEEGGQRDSQPSDRLKTCRYGVHADRAPASNAGGSCDDSHPP